ncbi:MAG TPA: hypothetical protein VH796_15575 [Nitrososphaeraceae archaeon]
METTQNGFPLEPCMGGVSSSPDYFDRNAQLCRQEIVSICRQRYQIVAGKNAHQVLGFDRDEIICQYNLRMYPTGSK